MDVLLLLALLVLLAVLAPRWGADSHRSGEWGPGAPHEQPQVRLALAGALRGIVCQRLVPRADGRGRCLTMEVCVNTGRVAEAIADPDKTSTITDLIVEGGYYGMQTFDQHLTALIRDGVVTLDDAMSAASSPHDLTVELRRLGLVA